MKKLLSLVLCLCLLLAGCGSQTFEETTEASTTKVVLPTAESTTHPTLSLSTEPVIEAPSLYESVVYDDGTYKLTAKEISVSDYSLKVKMLAENNSDRNVAFSGIYFTINGITTIGSMYINVAAGKKANDYISFNMETLENVGIHAPAYIISKESQIVDTDSYKTIANFDFDLKTSISDDYIQQVDRSGQTVYSSEGVTIKYRGVSSDSLGKEKLDFFIENTGNQDINVMVKDISVNGFTIYGNMCARAFENSCIYDSVTFLTKDIEANDIKSIEDVTIRFYACDNKTFNTLWVTDEIELSRTYVEEELQEEKIEYSEETKKADINSPLFDDKNLLITVKGLMLENHSDVNVILDGKTIVASYTYPGIAQVIPFVTPNNKELIENWNNLVEAARKECEAGHELIKACGTDYSFKIVVLNDLDKSKSLIECTDDKVTYDVLNSN